MEDQRYYNLVAGVVVVIVVVAGIAAFAVTPASPVTTRPTGVGPSGLTYYLNLTISYDMTAGGFAFNSTRLAVPLGATVVFTIANFDPASAPLPTPADANVVGTETGQMRVTDGAASEFVSVLPSGDVAHTFSMSDVHYKVNVPLPPGDGPSHPVLVTFSQVFTSPGTFQWGCVVLCGSEDMHGTSAMYGTLVVS